MSETRAGSAPVVRHRVDTSDPDEAETFMQAYTRFRAEPVDPAAFAFTLESAAAPDFGISSMRHTARFRADAQPPDVLTVSEALDGGVWVADRRQEAHGPLVLVPSWSDYACGWDTVTLRMTTIDLGAIARIGAERPGAAGEPVRFHSLDPRSPAHARYWNRLTTQAREMLADDELMGAPLLREEVLRQLITGLLVVFPNSTLEPGRDGPIAAEPAVVRRAVEFMDAHAQTDIDITRIAQAAHISPRGLQAAFRRHRGQTPLEYLRRVRLEGAHRDLRDGDPTCGDTVGGVSARWGFTHPGRFSVSYREAYGCSPSATLRA